MERENLFQTEITKMYLAYNRPVNSNLIKAKSELLQETLHNLKTSDIQKFFSLVREGEEALPTDGRLKKILTQNYHKFAVLHVITQNNDYDGDDYPTPEWKREFTKCVNFVVDGRMTTENAKKHLGI